MTSKFVSSLKRDLIQYGFTPRKFRARYFSEPPAPVLANSVPKSGTNLLTRLLYSNPSYRRKLANTLTNDSDPVIRRKLDRLRGGEFRPAHIYFTQSRAAMLREIGIKHIFIIRDPRDVAVSNVNYITRKATGHRLHNYFAQTLRSDAERLAASIVGIPGEKLPDGVASLGIGEHLSGYRGWLYDEGSITVKFEDLVGPNGGGTVSRQRESIAAILKYLELDAAAESIEMLADNLFSRDSRTFFRGEIGAWRSVFSDSDIQLFKLNTDNALIEMGYEDDENW